MACHGLPQYSGAASNVTTAATQTKQPTHQAEQHTCLDTPAEASSQPCSSNSREHTMSVQQLLPSRERWWCAGGRKEATSRSAAGACQLGCQPKEAAGRPPTSATAALLLPWLRVLPLQRAAWLLLSLALLPSLLLLLLLVAWLAVGPAPASPGPPPCCCRSSRRCRLTCSGPWCRSSEPSAEGTAEGTSASRAWSQRLCAIASGTTAASVVALGTRAREQGSSAAQLLLAAGRSPSPSPARSVQLRARFWRSQHSADPPGCRSRASAAQYTQSLESQLADRPSGRQPPSSGCREGQEARDGGYGAWETYGSGHSPASHSALGWTGGCIQLPGVANRWAS